MELHTVNHVLRSYTTELCPIVDHMFPLAHKLVKQNGAVEIDHADTRKRRFFSIYTDTHHLAIQSEIFSRSKKRLNIRLGPEPNDRQGTHCFCTSVYSTCPNTIFLNALKDSPFLISSGRVEVEGVECTTPLGKAVTGSTES